MSELLPGRQSERLRAGLLDYLTTTFALTDADAQAALGEFLADEQDGMFKGPFLRTGMPFNRAPRRAINPLDWMPSGFASYAHQAVAFDRLSSRDRRPQPTLVTTGTGSGKTEAFLVPILDHCLRARRQGVRGMKALILYPMNALANDQAQRIARLITGTDETGHQPLRSLTAALYTGEQGKKRTMVTEEGLITDRAIIRDDPPDILLTNYKMLDQLLLRAEDQKLWRESAESLSYLVLDEFHTYDGAQGTDVAMLLRRLGMALKSYWPEQGSGEDIHSPEEWSRPLGQITPVGTSATLGAADDEEIERENTPKGTEDIVDFASRVFGEPLEPSCVVGEERIDPTSWSRISPAELPLLDSELARTIVEGLPPRPTPEETCRTVLTGLHGGVGSTDLHQLVRSHPFIAEFLEATAQARGLAELADLIPGHPDTAPDRRKFIVALQDALGHLRARGDTAVDPLGGPDRDMPSTEVHLWIREVTRVDRMATSAPRYRWSDDGALLTSVEDDATAEANIGFPAIYCRQCGRSGWGVSLAPTGSNLSASDESIRRDHASREGRFRALLHAPAEGDKPFGEVPGLMWLDPRERCLISSPAEVGELDVREGRLLPVLALRGEDADPDSGKDVCPHCGQKDAIRFLGSAMATLLSVSLSTLFGEPGLDAAEKKALVFTDSVQDAAHRAGFVSSRSHSLTLRAVLMEAGDEPRTLPELVDQAIRLAGDDPHRRYRLLAPELTDREDMVPWWRDPAGGKEQVKLRRTVRQRLLFDAELEFGLASSYGRTLERTGAMSAHVEAGSAIALATLARKVVSSIDQPLDQPIDAVGDKALVAWVRGTLERMRTQGGIAHDWLEKYLQEDGARWWIWGGRRRHLGMPAFPPGRSAPAFPRVGGARISANAATLDAVTGAQSWYALWTARCLQLPAAHGGALAKALLDELTRTQTLSSVATSSHATVYSIPADRITVAPIADKALRDGRHQLDCDLCRSEFPGSAETIDQLEGASCLHARCTGTLVRYGVDESNYYRWLYQSSDARRVIAREHSSLLEDEIRVEYENGFKASSGDPSAPNVLVATPTLEMGIDIGDLSSVMLAGLPRTVANYVQRVGRAGRLSGNALDLAFVAGRGAFLPRLGDPTSLINGDVTPPATYLSAEEILRRQYLAHLADRIARNRPRLVPRTSGAAMRMVPDSYLINLIAEAETDSQQRLDGFLSCFANPADGKEILRPLAVEALRTWATPVAGSGTSPLADTVAKASAQWSERQQALRDQLVLLELRLPDLESRAADSDDDARALKEVQAETRLISHQLGESNREHWIATLEREGLLPNYSLVDDSVELDVTMSWVDDETGQYHSSGSSFRRIGRQALRDFSPGATFYADGRRIEINAVDLGHQGSAVETMWLCPHCGYVHGEATGPSECPRCESHGIADVGQRYESVELSKVSSHIRRDESRIDDRTDDRRTTSFTIMPTADINPDRILERWYTATGVGMTHMRGMDIRWFNLGPRRHTAQQRFIAGQKVAAPLFMVCRECGHVDRSARTNSKDDHRPWCSHRHDVEEYTQAVALHRHLVTEGIVLTLPPQVSIGDVFAVPSLRAAFLLGMQVTYGGAPDHIEADSVIDPRLGGNNQQAVLLFDTVPGGTGYLAELSDPARLRRVLEDALAKLRNCPCQHEERLACHRCLLPYTPHFLRDITSRSAAVEHLETMIGQGEVWNVTDDPPPSTFDPESFLEKRFRAAFIELADRLGGSVTQIPGHAGNTVVVRLGSRSFKLQPQVLIPPAKPDFVLSSEGLPDIVIFTDGWSFHASTACNNIDDDAHKRRTLRLDGRHVLAITADDVKSFETALSIPPPVWFKPALAQYLNAQPLFQHTSAARDALTAGPFEFLAMWLQGPDVGALQRFGRIMAVSLNQAGEEPTDDVLSQVAVVALEGQKARVWRTGSLAVASAPVPGAPGVVPLVAVLRSDGDLESPLAKESWREWLRVQNATMFLPMSQARPAGSVEVQPEAPVVDLVFPKGLNPEWERIEEEFEGETDAITVIRHLRSAEVPAPDGEVGMEMGDGYAFDLVWTKEKIAVQFNAPTDSHELPGWRILPPDGDEITRVWKELTRG